MRLLLVEDSKRLSRIVSDGLRAEGYGVDAAYDGLEAMELFERYDYDVAIVDLILPKLDGYGVLKQIRSKQKSAFVLVISARNNVEERIRGLEAGADDYLAKPFQLVELLARVQALVRRRYQSQSPVLNFGPVEVNISLKNVKIANQRLELTKMEFSILELLAMNKDKVISRDFMFEHLYGMDTEMSSNTIDVHVCSLRRKFHNRGVRNLIRTKRGYGYYVSSRH